MYRKKVWMKNVPIVSVGININYVTIFEKPGIWDLCAMCIFGT